MDHNGWSDIGYHFVIRVNDGVWRREAGRPIWKVGAHDQSENTGSVGICVCGNYSNEPLPEDAKELLVDLASQLKNIYNIRMDEIQGHNETGGDATLCPGYDMTEIRKLIFERGA
jgi:N-acetylmuramoyl-L-alanine amidase